jgi:lantibiotic modifying enzyme
VRFLNRATRIYAQALEQAASPKYLKDGRDFSIQLEILTRAYLTTDDKPHNWSILAAELEQIHRCDIPFFQAKANSEALDL